MYVPDARVVRVGVEHDDGEGKDERGVRGGEDVRVGRLEPLCELLEDPVYLLRLAWDAKAGEELPQRQV